jgi:uncharacterized membrane protein (DUF2068 family)
VRLRLSSGEGLASLGYGMLELVEGVGLWLDQLWAEYLVVIASSLLIPFEVYELARHPSIWKAGGILVNVLIVPRTHTAAWPADTHRHLGGPARRGD